MHLGCTLRQWLWSTLFSLLLTTTYVLANDTLCVVHENGKIYDLNLLKSKTDYQVMTQKGRKLFLNVCQSVKTEMFGLKDDAVAPSEIGAFIRRDHGDFSIGKFNMSISVFNSEPRFTMADGSQCATGSSNARASSLVNLICDSSVSGFGTPQLVGSLPPGDEDAACAFIIEWKTPYACGISETGGPWKFFTSLIVTLLVLLAIYTILGTLYNHFVLNLKGLDSIPQFSFQSMRYHLNEVLEWIKDVVGILLIDYCSSNSGGRGYNLPSHHDNPRTPNPISHQAQVFGIVNGGANDEQEQEQQSGDGFTIPSPLSPRQQQQATNPVSHHTQTVQRSHFQTTTALSPRSNSNSLSHLQPLPPPQPLPSAAATSTPTTPPQTLPQYRTQSQTQQQFMLFSTDEQLQDEDSDVARGKGSAAVVEL